ncbi:filamentous hemagglutinin N-terminal domain-containing protein [Paraburkholderia tropica]|uniref:two-partner secretion domain-containing protein n=1 Tax=Paraburkholderia tropica TaxID=92647 RepID=UPI003D2E7829
MRATAAIMTVVMYFTPAMLLADQAAHAAPPIVDPRAPVQFQPTITQTGAGVPAVNITAPNAAGLSVNQYSSFGVDAGTGLVLNNSLVSGTTLLGGALGANPNLAGRTATTILNQVTSTAPAILAGPLEVFGSPASVIVAAPNGVSVSGLSLTNAPGLVLTTGVPQFITGPGGAAASFANAGAVAFAVSSGNVSIHGAPGSTGANGPGAGIEGTVGNIDLIGQSVSLNAPLYANQAVNVVTGNQTVTPTPGSTGSAYWTSNVVAGQPGAVAVDASAFGSVTAGQVFIVSTAAGQGVNLQGPLAATAGNVSVSAAGDIVVGKTFGSENVTLASGGNVSINDTGLANQNYTVTATGDIKASGSVAGAKDVSLPGTHVTISASQGITNSGTIGQGTGSLTLNGDLNNTGTVTAQGLTLNGNLTNAAGATVQANDSLALNGSGTNRGTVEAQNNLSINGASYDNSGATTRAGSASGTSGGVGNLNINVSGDLTNAGGTITATNDLSVNAARVVNSGSSGAGGATTTTTTTIDNPALLLSLALASTNIVTGSLTGGENGFCCDYSGWPVSLTLADILSPTGAANPIPDPVVGLLLGSAVPTAPPVATSGTVTFVQVKVMDQLAGTSRTLWFVETPENAGKAIARVTVALPTVTETTTTTGGAPGASGSVIAAGHDLNLNADTLQNSGGTVSAGNDANIHVQTLDNSGSTYSSTVTDSVDLASLNAFLSAMPSTLGVWGNYNGPTTIGP